VRADPARGRAEGAACAHVLVVDDDAAARVAIEALLRSAGFATSTAGDGEAALSANRRSFPDIVLTDLEMPQIDGAELCQRLREIDGDLPVIVMTAHSSMQAVIEVLRAGGRTS
jgi:DNA-binding response OmpR family regulator